MRQNFWILQRTTTDFCGRDFVKVLQKLGKDTVAEMLQGVKREVDEKAKEAGKSGGQVLR